MATSDEAARVRVRLAERLASNQERIAARTERCLAAERAGRDKTAALTEAWQRKATAIQRRAADRRGDSAGFAPKVSQPRVLDFTIADDDPADDPPLWQRRRR